MISPDIHLVFLVCVFFISTLVRSTFGFGDALVAMPLMSLMLDLRVASPLFALITTTISLLILSRTWRDVCFKSVWRLILSSIAGIPLGLYALKGAHDNVMKLILAVMIIGFSTYKLATPRLLTLKTDRSSFLFGFLAGIMGGAYNTNGPLVVVYGSLRQWSPVSFRATLQGFFIVNTAFIVLGHYFAGFLTKNVLDTYIIIVPVVVLAILLGTWFHHKIPSGKFDNYIHILLILIGLYLFVNVLQQTIARC